LEIHIPVNTVFIYFSKFLIREKIDMFSGYFIIGKEEVYTPLLFKILKFIICEKTCVLMV